MIFGFKYWIFGCDLISWPTPWRIHVWVLFVIYPNRFTQSSDIFWWGHKVGQQRKKLLNGDGIYKLWLIISTTRRFRKVKIGKGLLELEEQRNGIFIPKILSLRLQSVGLIEEHIPCTSIRRSPIQGYPHSNVCQSADRENKKIFTFGIWNWSLLIWKDDTDLGLQYLELF